MSDGRISAFSGCIWSVEKNERYEVENNFWGVEYAELSIIVPVYNVEKYLRECVDSILNQTFTDFELILVDDGSPDNCPQICDAYAEQDNRVRVIHQKNGGLSAARNAGIEAARGNWLGFIDSDDFIAPDFYEKLYKAARDADADCAICGVQWTAEDGHPIETPDVLKAENGFWTGEEILETIKNRMNYAWMIAVNKIYRHDIFETIRYPVGRLNEDVFVFAELFDTVEKAVCVEEPMYFYRQQESSIMHKAKTCRNLDESRAFYHWFVYFEEHKKVELLIPTEKLVFAKLTNVYYELPRKDRHDKRTTDAKKMQLEAVKKLHQHHILSGRTLFRTIMFQFLPDVYGSCKTWRK